MNTRQRGTNWENIAGEYLRRQGVRIVEHSFRNRSGEIDLIGMDGKVLVFFEVKYRSNALHGRAEEAVDGRKQRTICRVSDYYRYTHGIGDDAEMRYDVLAINGEEITWYRNAFPYCNR